jgi:hypothetical protein
MGLDTKIDWPTDRRSWYLKVTKANAWGITGLSCPWEK